MSSMKHKMKSAKTMNPSHSTSTGKNTNKYHGAQSFQDWSLGGKLQRGASKKEKQCPVKTKHDCKHVAKATSMVPQKTNLSQSMKSAPRGSSFKTKNVDNATSTVNTKKQFAFVPQKKLVCTSVKSRHFFSNAKLPSSKEPARHCKEFVNTDSNNSFSFASSHNNGSNRGVKPQPQLLKSAPGTKHSSLKESNYHPTKCESTDSDSGWSIESFTSNAAAKKYSKEGKSADTGSVPQLLKSAPGTKHSSLKESNYHHLTKCDSTDSESSWSIESFTSNAAAKKYSKEGKSADTDSVASDM